MLSTDEQIKPQMFHEFLRDKIDQSNIKQSDIAAELSFDRANIISMFKAGKTRVPLRSIPQIAKILNIDPKQMLRMAMLEYCPETLKAVEQVFGGAITKNEQGILNEIRKLSQGTDPKIISIAHRQAVEEFVKGLMIKQLKTAFQSTIPKS